MIKLKKLTPEIYYNSSRDFQFIGRLYDLVVNSVKTNADLLYNLPLNDNTDSRFIDLLALTLGFNPKHEYNIKQLTAICSTFIEMIKNKGNIYSIQLAGQALLNSAGVEDKFYCFIDYDKNPTLVNIYIPPSIKDINLFLDLLDYILPIGMNYRILNASTTSKAVLTKVKSMDTITINKANDNSFELGKLNSLELFIKGLVLSQNK